MPILAAALLLAVQQVPTGTGLTSPVNGDTVGYWQQRVEYSITATLDEGDARVRATGTMKYVNNSPDTLREMYVHQYLNAFRPHSRWSSVDEREGRVRFQHLRDPDYAYERFTAPVLVNGLAVSVQYPGTPDSTVARLGLPAPLRPGDSIVVSFAWEARPSTLPRRQGRRGRHWDLAQWYPKVAVYDRGGWQHNALQPAGEFYGEFGIYDVTLVVPTDQVIGAVGVPVSGDPGWRRADRAASVGGSVRDAANAYGAVPAASLAEVPDGYKAVRFLARDVHHFAWSASPDYRYEGAVYARPVANTRGPAWDTVSVHVLMQPGDDSTWGGGLVTRRTVNALRWLEMIYGPYAYPQMTVLHRIEGGGTEFPMLQMNGSPSLGLILHEGGHVWTYGILANNEWRSGWMDEGLTSYQTEWAQTLLPQERLRQGITDRFRPPTGYRGGGRSLALSRFDAIGLQRAMTDIRGGAQPISTTAHEFRDFGTYNDMIYSRAQVMYSQLRDELGDSLFVSFLHDYYSRWALRHVDERAMRASAERVSGRDLGWFFRQWVHETGVLDYEIRDVRSTRSDGGWVTEAVVRRRGEYRHSMPVGVRTPSGWTIARIGDPLAEQQTVRIVTAQEPLEVRLDPHHFTWDWNRRNDVPGNRPRVNFDWPFLAQADRERTMLLWSPNAWYSRGGGATVGARSRSTYLHTLDRFEFGVVAPARADLPDKIQWWARTTDPNVGFLRRPAAGFSAGAALLDDVFRADVGRRRERSIASRDVTEGWAITYAEPLASDLLPEMWHDVGTLDLSFDRRVRETHATGGGHRFSQVQGLIGQAGSSTYLKGEVAISNVASLSPSSTLGVRGYLAGVHGGPPAQRALFVSAADPLAMFENHWWRPAGGILKQPNVNWLPLGGAALRGYAWDVFTEGAAAVNVELSRRLTTLVRSSHQLEFRINGFADGALTSVTVPLLPGPTTDRADGFLMDAGIGLGVRGRIFDRPLTLRIDSPFYVSRPVLAIDRGRQGRGEIAPRWAISLTDLW
ncbi:MAG: M1 family metallopeptidase [Gemmatimonadaceae bacterium]